MNQERWAEIKRLFQAALDLPPSERAAFLQQQCGDNEDLRREVKTMLRDAEAAASFIETPALDHFAAMLKQNELSLIGQTIAHYHIEAELGAGGMGQVFKARDAQLKRHVAIKILPAEFTADPARVRRFEQEAYAASALNHPCIITIYEVGQVELDGWPLHYIAYELIEGQTLRERLRQTRLAWPEVVGIAIQIAEALKAAHSARIFHRDIKPENIMLREDGVVKVLDFGIAKLGKGDGTTGGQGGTEFEIFPSPRLQVPSSLTSVGIILGTASYMSPEQARGETVDGRSDLFSLGAVMYEMAMGERLFAGATPVEVTEQLLRPQELLPAAAKFSGKARLLEPIIRKCLRRKREERYASAAELLSELQRLKRQIETRFIRRVVAAVSLIAALAMVVLGLVIPASIREEWGETQMRDGHTKAVRQFAIAPDGKKLVSTSNDAKIIVWDVATRIRLATLTQNDSYSVSAVAFAPDSRVFATSCADGTVNVWDAETYAKLAVVDGHKGSVKRIVFSPDGRWLLTASGDWRHTVWETGSWRRVRDSSITGLGAGAHPVISPDSRYLLTTSWIIWDLAKGDALTKPQLGGWYWSALAPDATRLVTAESSGFISFWDVHQFWPSGQKRLIKREQAHRERAFAAAYSPDGRYLRRAAKPSSCGMPKRKRSWRVFPILNVSGIWSSRRIPKRWPPATAMRSC